MLEAVVPFRMVKSHREQGVAGESKALAAGVHVDDAMSGSVAAGEFRGHTRSNLVLVFEDVQMILIVGHELVGSPTQNVRHRLRHFG
ncbi:hypothetical protein D3C81_1676180 [compost metagenome]